MHNELKTIEVVTISRNKMVFLACFFWQCARSFDFLRSGLSRLYFHPEESQENSKEEFMDTYFKYHNAVIKPSAIKAKKMLDLLTDEDDESGNHFITKKYRWFFVIHWYICLLTNRTYTCIKLEDVYRWKKILNIYLWEIDNIKTATNIWSTFEISIIRKHLTRCFSNIDQYIISRELKSLIHHTEHFHQSQHYEFLSIDDIMKKLG